MTCRACGKDFETEDGRCPHCGEAAPATSGVFQSSTVLISAGGGDHIYRSVEEVPAALRTRLLKSTNGANSATILIADRRGHQEIAKAMRSLPGPAQKRILEAVGAPSEADSWWAPGRRKVALALLVVIALAFLVWVLVTRT